MMGRTICYTEGALEQALGRCHTVQSTAKDYRILRIIWVYLGKTGSSHRMNRVAAHACYGDDDSHEGIMIRSQ